MVKWSEMKWIVFQGNHNLGAQAGEEMVLGH